MIVISSAARNLYEFSAQREIMRFLTSFGMTEGNS